MTRVNLNNLAEREPLSTAGLQIVHVRKVNGRIACDVVNELGELLLSGTAQWVVDTCYEREYFIANWNDAVIELEKLGGSWGVY